MHVLAVILLVIQLKAAICNEINEDSIIAEASEPNVIQIDAYGKVSTNSDTDQLDDKRLMLEEMRLRREMSMRRRRRTDGPTIIMMPSPPAYPASEPPAYAPHQPPAADPERYAAYDSRSYPSHSKSCYVTTNVCDRSQDDAIKKTVQRTVQKSIETSVKSSLKQALVPLVEELTRRMSEEMSPSNAKKYKEDINDYAKKYIEKL